MKNFEYKESFIKTEKIDDEDQLFIDDRKIPFIKKDDGYSIFYNQGHKTLEEATKAFLDTQKK